MRWELNEKQAYQYPAFWIIAALLVTFAVTTVLTWERVHRRYQRWSEEKLVHRAAVSFASGDLARVLIDARGALQLNRQNVEATRLIAQVLEAGGSPESVEWRRQLDLLQPGDAENLLALTASLLKRGDPESAGEALQEIKTADQSSARYHETAANLAVAKNDAAGAETHWAEALRLNPAEETYRLKLAEVQLNSRTSDVRQAALQLLESMSESSPQRLLARRALVTDAWRNGPSARLVERARTLVADPDATFTDKLVLLTALQQFSTAEFSAHLAQMQKAAEATPEALYQMLTWMNEHHLALLVPEWEAALASEVSAKAPVCLAIADAYARGSNWQRLNEKLEGASWEYLEPFRFAYLARARERWGDHDGAEAAWVKSLTAAQTRADYLDRLGKLATEWNWPVRAEEALWKLSAFPNCPRWAVEYLWAASLKKGDTALLCKASWLKLRLSPKNTAGRNNYANLALLIGKDLEIARHLAEANYRENPTDPNIATTYGLSLTQQEKPDSAVTIMETFSEEQLKTPNVAVYYAIFLAAAGQSEKAEQFLKFGHTANLLPEERSLVSKATAAVPIEAITNLGR